MMSQEEAEIIYEAAALVGDPSTSPLFGLVEDTNDNDQVDGAVIAAVVAIATVGAVDMDSLSDPYGMSITSNEWSE